MNIDPSETTLTGRWVPNNQGGIQADAACERINSLVQGRLKKLGRDPSRWDALYRDPDDGRLWELIYPQSELQGGGPPQLRYLTIDEAKQKYGAIAISR